MKPSDIEVGEFYATTSWSRIGRRKVQVTKKLAGRRCMAQAKDMEELLLYHTEIECPWSVHAAGQKKAKQRRESIKSYGELIDAEREMIKDFLAMSGIEARVTGNGGPRYNRADGQIEGSDTRLNLSLRDLARLLSSVPEGVLDDLDPESGATLIADHEQLQKLIQRLSSSRDMLDDLLSKKGER